MQLACIEETKERRHLGGKSIDGRRKFKFIFKKRIQECEFNLPGSGQRRAEKPLAYQHKICPKDVRFEVFTAVTMKNAVF
jgi:hypothetical protein